MDRGRKKMRSEVKSKISHYLVCFLSMISPRLNYRYRYKKIFGRKIDLDNPRTFNEKILWLELNRYMNDEVVIQCSDKYRVREYVRACGCEELLIPHLGVWNKVKDIPWDELPDKFVLKWNFGAGYNYICRDKKAADKKEAFMQLDKWGRARYWLWYAEMHYKNIPRKIICEQYIDAVDLESGKKIISKSPDDYKLYCFNGKVHYILFCLNRNKMNADYVFFDKEWNLQPFSSYALNNSERANIERPDLLDAAIRYAEILAKPFPFVRVDFYILKDTIYFGEMTFTPCGGMDSDIFTGDEIMGQLLEIRA